MFVSLKDSIFLRNRTCLDLMPVGLLRKVKGGKFSGKIIYPFFDFFDCLFGRFPSSMKIMTEHRLTYPGYSLQTSQTE